MKDDDLLRLWGKTNRPQNTAYHPLLFHLLDVAHCAGQLWDRLPAPLRKRIANALGLAPDKTRYAVMLLAGLHDLGKACPPFQYQSEHFREQVRQIGLIFASDVSDYNKPHGT